MFIYFNGDSNVAGEELEDRSKSMAGMISQHLGAKYTNDAVSGASNDRIYDTTLEYLRNNPKPDLIVIGWTEHGREQWYFEGKFHEINQLDVGNRVPEKFRRRYQFWKDRVKTSGHWHDLMGYYWHNKVFNLHTMLLEKDIPHYFFNTFYHFHHEERERLDWKNYFFRPYHQACAYVTWCQMRNFQEITPGWQHYEEAAHAAWANELVKTMRQDSII